MKKCLFKVQSVVSKMSTVSNIIWSGMFYLIACIMKPVEKYWNFRKVWNAHRDSTVISD